MSGDFYFTLDTPNALALRVAKKAGAFPLSGLYESAGCACGFFLA